MEQNGWMDCTMVTVPAVDAPADHNVDEPDGLTVDSDNNLLSLLHGTCETSPHLGHQQVLFTARKEETFTLPENDTLLPPPPYHEAVRSMAGWSPGLGYLALGASDSTALPAGEMDFHLNPSSEGNLFTAAESMYVSPSSDNELVHFDLARTTTIGMAGTTTNSFPAGPHPSPSATVSYPSRPQSNPGEVPSTSTALTLTSMWGSGDFSLYAANSLAGDLQEPLAPSLPPSTPRPQSNASMLSDIEYWDISDCDFRGNEGVIVEDLPSAFVEEKEEEEKKKEEEETKEDQKNEAEGKFEDMKNVKEKDGQALEQNRKATSLSEEKEKLLEDMMATTSDEELRMCARRMVETNDPILLTKVMLKTKLELHYMNKGQNVPDVSQFPGKQESHELRPDEKEKADKRKKNGRVSAKTYREKQKRMKLDKDLDLKEQQERNAYLKKQAHSLEEQIDQLRSSAIERGLLAPAVITTSATATAASAIFAKDRSSGLELSDKLMPQSSARPLSFRQLSQEVSSVQYLPVDADLSRGGHQLVSTAVNNASRSQMPSSTAEVSSSLALSFPGSSSYNAGSHLAGGVFPQIPRPPR